MRPLLGVLLCVLGARAASVRGAQVTQDGDVTLNRHLTEAPSDRRTDNHQWRRNAIRELWRERINMKYTPLYKYTYPGRSDVEIVFKNESASVTGSLKHRYAWALVMWALIEGHINQNTTVFEASSGNTAASLAYMCRLLKVPFTAVCPDTLEAVKQHHIEEYGASVHKVDISMRLKTARRLAEEHGGFFMNQFGNADRAEEFHESGGFPLESVNMYHEILTQLEADPLQAAKIPHYFVHAAGTGGTISSVGRYVTKYNKPTQVVMADTQFSVYFDYVVGKRFSNESGADLWVRPGMAGIGYGPMGPVIHGQTSSLTRNVIDRVIKVPDLASTAGMKVLREQGINGGTSSGLNFVAALSIAAQTPVSQEKTTIATILADPAHYYTASYYNETWIEERFARHGGITAYHCWLDVVRNSVATGSDPLEEGRRCPKGNLYAS